MNENMRKRNEVLAQTVIKGLESRNISGYYAKDKEEALQGVESIFNQLLETSFEVNNVSHELEKETVYQRETVDSIRQIVDYLYAISGDGMF